MSCLIVVVLTRQQTQEIEMHTSNDLIKRKVAQTRKTEAMQGPKKKVASKHKLTKEVQAVKKRYHFSVTTR